MSVLNQELLKIKELSGLKDFEKNRFPVYISGLTETSRAHLVASIKENTKRPVVIICSDERYGESMKKNLSGLLKEDCNLLFDRDFHFFSSEAASHQREHQRMMTLEQICSWKNDISVMTVTGGMMRTIPADYLKRTETILHEAEEVLVEDIENALIRSGYEKTEQVEGKGQYSKRGGILDIFSPVYEKPLRIEFWGDEIDSISFFDIDSQRREKTIKEARIIPASETILSMYEGGKWALQKNLSEKADRLQKTAKTEKQDELIKTLRRDAEKIRENISISYADRYLPQIYPFATAMDYIPDNAVIIIDQPKKIEETAREYGKKLIEEIKTFSEKGVLSFAANQYYLSWDKCCQQLENHPVVMLDSFTSGKLPFAPQELMSVSCKQLSYYNGSFKTIQEDLETYIRQEYRIVFLSGEEKRGKKLQQIMKEHDLPVSYQKNLRELPEPGKCIITEGTISSGMEYPSLRLVIFTDNPGTVRPIKASRRSKQSNYEKISSYMDLHVGDLVVHEYHGIGQYTGIEKITVDGCSKDYIKINYAGSDCLYVPCTQLDLVAKYIGGGEERQVKLSKMGGTDWVRTRQRAKKAAKEMAQKLIALYAERQLVKGYAFTPDTDWQMQFEENFEYEETDDQLKCVNEIKKDMESPIPMDRLLCGDVGYGKTEVAMRAAMKCILDNKQVAFLCPTTVLANQHYQTAIQRFSGFPVTIEIISRFQTGKELKKTLENMRSGKTDIVIGTHRLLQKDIEFKNLGLLIVDEEQRFGVTHKEHIKEMSKGIDVLTLSATPIPRTLNMSLSGIRDMSIIEEPPRDRQPVQTFVMEHDWDVVGDAMRKELIRGGQIYYVHNRIDTIERTARKLHEILGEDVAIGVAHGRMDKNQLSGIMERMADGEIQILLCTTIIETGIDIPNVNTLVIEDADRMGLAQLHQLRGRVGRSTRKAYAYLTYRKDKVLTEIQEKRLSTIREFVEFGSGFKIAMRDLEIRGAGNVLGAEQSGHMLDVGYDMYIKLLDEAVKEEKGEIRPARCDCSIDFTMSANIPDSYVSSQEQRMDLYRKIALIKTEEEQEDVIDELIDRFGEPPRSVFNLLQIALMKNKASDAGISEIVQKQEMLFFTLENFEYEYFAKLLNNEHYKNRLKLEAGNKPRVSLRILSKEKTTDLAMTFINNWKEEAEQVKKG